MAILCDLSACVDGISNLTVWVLGDLVGGEAVEVLGVSENGVDCVPEVVG